MTAEDLRKAILQQAIQGKLVPQDPNDEPASILLERIREEKVRLVKEKKIKKDKNESIIYRGEDNSHYEKILATGEIKCIDDEIPFEIPNTWEWIRLGSIVSVLGDGIHGTPVYDNLGNVYFVNGNNLSNGKIVIKSDTKKLNNIEAQKHKRVLDETTILVSINGTIGNIAFYNNENIILGKSACYFNVMGKISKKYIKIIIESDYFNKYAQKVATGTTIKNVPLWAMRTLLIPLPPLDVQKRIAQRIEEIQPLIDKYRVAQEQVEEMDKSLNALLKKSILQYAIQGKLVSQIESEEPASILLEKILQEKLKLVKEGKLKKKDLDNSVIFKGEDNKYFEKKGNEVVCIDDEIPFEIPDSWEWARLGNCCTLIGGYAFKSHEIKSQFGHRVIRISDISDEGLTDNNIVRYNGTLDLSKYKIINNDILIAMTGGTVGKSMLFSSKSNDVLLLNQRVAIIRYNLILPQYIYAFIKSPYIKEIIDNAKNSTNDNISMADISDFLIPLPPLDEQKRIVKALDNVLASIMRN